MITQRPPPPPWAHPSLTAPGPCQPRRIRAAAGAPPTAPGPLLTGAQLCPPFDGQLAHPTAGGQAGACAARGRGGAEGRRVARGAALRAWRVRAKRGLLARRGSNAGRKGSVSAVGKQRRAEAAGGWRALRGHRKGMSASLSYTLAVGS